MRTTLLEVTKHYSEIFTNLANLLHAFCEESPNATTYAIHLMLQFRHHAENAIIEIQNLPAKSEH